MYSPALHVLRSVHVMSPVVPSHSERYWSGLQPLQSRQGPAVGLALYFPVAQRSHPVEPVDVVEYPTGQFSQFDPPLVAAYVPLGQFTHVLLFSYFPWPHGWQDDCPDSSAIVPSAQVLQLVSPSTF